MARRSARTSAAGRAWNWSPPAASPVDLAATPRPPFPRSRDQPPVANRTVAARGARSPPGDGRTGTGAGSRHHVQLHRAARRDLLIMRPAVIITMSLNGIGVAFAGIMAFALGG